MRKLFFINSKFVYVITIMLCIILLILIYDLGKVDIAKPIVYDLDSISASYLMKTVDETGWYLKNPHVGGSFGGDFYDYVMSDGLSFLLVKIISLFTNNVFAIYNLFYFLTYILVAVTCLYALIELGVKKCIAVVCSLLYTFLPFHQQRMVHIWLEPYFLLPLVGLVALWLVTDKLKFERENKKSIIVSIWNNTKLRQALIISFLASSTGLYYAFFTCCVYAVAFLINCLKGSIKKQILFPIYFIFMTIVGVILNIIPHVVYLIQNGMNPASELAIRSPSEAEMYGLKMIQLLLPRLDHRISILNHIASSYYAASPLTNENHTSALGIIGSIGFILLMLKIFDLKSKNKLDNGITLLNLGTLLIATIGGVGAIFSYTVKTPMRCYNRISIVIAFFSLLYIGIIISRLVENHFKSYSLKTLYYIGCVILLVFGIYDQTVPYTAKEQKQTIVEYESDNKFVMSIENSVPSGSMIYQLPHICFPSGSTYAHFKGYLNSDKLIWSYGGMQGREQDLWEHAINELPTEDMLQKLSVAGYEGIYIDTSLYESKEKSTEVITQISNILDEKPMFSENRRLLFLNMHKYNVKIKNSYNEAEYKNLQQNVYKIINLDYKGEFSVLERNSNGDTWHWCGSDGLLEITNPSTKDVKLVLSTQAVIPTGDSSIYITINKNKPTSYNVKSTVTQLDLEILLKPGKNSVLFHCDAPRYESPPDTRELVFYLWNTKVRY